MVSTLQRPEEFQKRHFWYLEGLEETAQLKYSESELERTKVNRIRINYKIYEK